MSEKYKDQAELIEYHIKQDTKKHIEEFIEKMRFIEEESENPKKMAREYKLMYRERLEDEFR